MKNSTFYKVLKLLRPYGFWIFLSLFLSLFSVAVSLLIPILVGSAIDFMLGAGRVDFPSILKILAAIGVSVGTAALAQYGTALCNNHISFRVVFDLREKAFSKIQSLPLSFLDRCPAGDIISRMITDVDVFSDGLLLGFSQLFTGVLTIIGTLIFMLAFNWKIAIIVVLLTPLSFFLAKFIAGRTFSLFQKQTVARGEQTSFVEEIITHQKTVSAFGAEEESIRKFDALNDKLEKVSLRALFYSSMVNPSTRLVNALVYACVCLAGALSVLANPAFTIGSLSCLLNYASQYAKPFNEISGVVAEFQNALACAERLFTFLSEPEESSDRSLPELCDVRGEVLFDRVSFSYTKDRRLIENLEFKASPGQKIAIVGPTGCGKTTLINLLLRFYDIDSGSILIDNTPIDRVTRRSLRQNFGMVLQDTWLKSGTIRENLFMGNSKATEEEMLDAAKKTKAHSFIKRLPKGYDTVIGEEGGILSEGQKQLLSITRVMLLSPPILILDEATSSIDVRTEMQVQKAFDALMRGRTSFIVAHRLSTIQEADCILVMQKGKIVEKGTHEELLKQKGFYYTLYYSQFA